LQITDWLEKLGQLLSSCQPDKTAVGKLRSKLSSHTEVTHLLQNLADDAKFPGGQVPVPFFVTLFKYLDGGHPSFFVAFHFFASRVGIHRQKIYFLKSNT
jgi:hypothetical protein